MNLKCQKATDWIFFGVIFFVETYMLWNPFRNAYNERNLGVDGFLYVTGGGVNRVPLWKIDPDAMRGVGVFGNPFGDGFGFGDNGTRLVNPMAITSRYFPSLI